MKKKILTIIAIILSGGISFAQLDTLADFNILDLPSMPDTLKPYFFDQGARSVWVAESDLDDDGKPEILLTDYSNKGRVHVFELSGNTLELVWSSPLNETGGGSTPRWVRTGDLDGDGKDEIIFPNATSTAATGEVRIRVFEWDGTTDNEYIHAIDLAYNTFSSQGVGDFRMSREVADVYDYDGDGSDELITANRDNRTYILGITGDVPGFGGWQLEGGDPATVPKIGNGSWWHAVPADLNGDGDIEIVNHFWNFYGFYSIDPTAADTYQYPDTSLSNEYIEFTNPDVDAVGYMGIQPADVDGDGSDEIALIQYSAASDNDYDMHLINFESTDNELYSWTPDKIGKITTNAWEISGATVGSFWGIGAADINSNGREEVLLGGGSNYHVVAVEYKGTGGLLDPANYDLSVYYDGPEVGIYESITFNDSAGVVDTVFTETPFISKMYAGSDINNNGKLEVIASYQSVYDTVRYIYKHWDGNAFVEDSVVRVQNPYQINMRVLESTLTGVKEYNYEVVTPDDYVLEQNYPNPFNPSTTIRFSLPIQKKISITVYDILGNEVKTLIDNQDFEKGGYEVTWDGTNNSGNTVASGQYIYTLKYGNFTKSMKMTLLK
jgi:hypothetical protein